MNENTLTKEWLADNEVVTEEQLSILQTDKESAINYLMERIEPFCDTSIGLRLELGRMSSFLVCNFAYTLAANREALITAQDRINELEDKLDEAVQTQKRIYVYEDSQ